MLRLKLLCDENDINFIDHYRSFLLASGESPESYANYFKTLKNIVRLWDLQCHQGQNPRYIDYVASLLLVQDITSHLGIAIYVQ